jgi:dephospho-CoA kinase
MVFKLHKVAITGSIASGKSTVRHILEHLGAYTVDADQILHQAFTTDTLIGRKIVALFGDEILENGNIQRGPLAKLIINRPDALDKLEDICHPYVNSEILKRYNEVDKTGDRPLFVVEMPLLFESRDPIRDWFDTVVLVVSDKNNRTNRYALRRKPLEQLTFLEGRQASSSIKQQAADVVLENNADLQTLEHNVKALFDLLCRQVQ